MKRSFSIPSLITVISLLLGVIWLSPVLAADAPSFVSLGQIEAEGMYAPSAMDIDDAGGLYVVDGRNGNVYLFDKYGALSQELQVGATGRGLAVTPEGTQLFVSLKHAVAIYDLVDGGEPGYLTSGTDPLTEFGLAGEIDLDSHGNIYVTDVSSNASVRVYAKGGQLLSSFGEIGVNAGQFKQLGGMAVNAANQVIVTDQAGTNGQVHVFTLDPVNYSVQSVIAYPRDSFGPTPLKAGLGVTFDSQGRGYILDFNKSKIKVVGPDFGYLTEYPSDPEAKSGRDAGQLSDVYDVVMDMDAVHSRLLVSCGGRVEVFGIDGGTSPEYVNYAPTKPVAQSPIGEVASAMPTLVTNSSTDDNGDSLTYQFTLSQDDQVVLQKDESTTSSVVDVVLTENTTYSWTVQATDGYKTSDPSDTVSFAVNVVEEAPTVPVLTAPVGGASVNGLGVLSWMKSTDPDPADKITYQVEVALDEGFANIVATATLAENLMPLNAFATYAELVYGTDYFWRVAALNGNSDGLKQSAASDVGQFVYNTTTLIITANMPDAVVSFSGNHAYAGQSVGAVPVELLDFVPGTLSVVVERAGFEPFVAQVTVDEGDNVDLYAELVPAMSVGGLKANRKGINGRSGLSVSGDAAPFLVDFDNDGDLDLLVGDSSGEITIFANMQISGRNRLSFDKGKSLLSTAPGAVPFVVDWNNDGLKDLIVGLAGGTVRLFTNVSSEVAPAFAAGVDLEAGGASLSVTNDAAPAVVDYEGDGDKDLLVGNGSGQLFVYENIGSDATPNLAGAVELLQLSGAVVPFPVDWDADGQQELLLTANGVVTVYTLVDGVYQAGQKFKDRRSDYVAAFPIDLNGSGKQLLAGQSNGKLVYLAGKSSEPVESFHTALQDKVAELADLIAEGSALIGDVNAIDSMVRSGDYSAAADSTSALLAALPEGAAQQSAMELLALL